MFKSSIQVLSDADKHRIHTSALEILRDVGARVDHQRMRDLLRDNGCLVDNHVVRFPETVVESVVERMRNPEHQDRNYIGTLPLDWSRFPADARVIPVATGQATMAHDMVTDRLRPATTQDLIDACRILDQLPGVVTGHPVFIPQDVPEMVRDLHTLATVAQYYPYSDFVEIYSPEAVPYFLEVGRVVSPSEAALKQSPPFCSWAFATPPLVFGSHGFDILFQLLDAGVKSRFGVGGVMPVLGASTPVTLAGYLVMQTAEILACNVMNWLLLGRVIGYGGGATILDMKHTTPSQSGPEVTLLFLACMELQRYYGLAEPMFPYALNADAKIPDVQAGIEKAITATLAVVAGSRLLSAGLGCLFLSGVASLPQIAIDYELCQFLDHMAKGIVVNDTTIALDVIKSVGIGGSFLGEQHTVRHFREVMFFSDLFDRRTPGQWQTDCQGMLNLAKQKVKGMLERDNPPPYLTGDQAKELTRIVAHAGAQLSHHR